MKKIVINECYGGFSLSQDAMEYLRIKYNIPVIEINEYYMAPDNSKLIFIIHKNYNSSKYYINDYFDTRRDDPMLIEVVELLGSKKASGRCAKLKIKEIPDTSYVTISEYDGFETVKLISEERIY